MFEFSNGRPLQEYNKRLDAQQAQALAEAQQPPSAYEQHIAAQNGLPQRLYAEQPRETPSFGVSPKQPPAPPPPNVFERTSALTSCAVSLAVRAECLLDVLFGPLPQNASDGCVSPVRSGLFGVAHDELDVLDRSLARIAAAVKRLEQLQ